MHMTNFILEQQKSYKNVYIYKQTLLTRPINMLA